MSAVDFLQQKLANVDADRSHGRDKGTGEWSNVAKAAATDIAVEVHRTLADASKRKQNVVVSGLPESDHVTDEQAFLTLCEENFSFKPALSQVGCRRLGKTTDQRKSRKLLIHLRSEEAASSILREAKKLRKSDNRAVSSSVYINPDRSPAESKLAFEMRQQRRKRLAEQASKRINELHDHLVGPTSVLSGTSNLPSPDTVTDFVPKSTNVAAQSLTVVNSPFHSHK